MSIRVGHNQPIWIPSGTQVRKGDVVKITATGTIRIQNQSAGIGPGGQKDREGNPVLPPDPNYVAPKLPVFALIGIISQSAPSVPPRTGSAFLVGDAVEHVAEADGQLYLIANDNVGFFHDNTGSFDVTITVVRQDFPIVSGSEFEPGKRAYASDKSHFLIFQPDGNLVIYKGQQQDPANATWAFNRPPANLAWPSVINRIKRVVFEDGGNLVAYDGAGQVVWQTGTTGHPAAQLQLDTNTGTLYITDGGTKIWPA